MFTAISKIEQLLQTLLTFENDLRPDQAIKLHELNAIKEVITSLITIALNDVKKKKEVRMCTAILFDHQKKDKNDDTIGVSFPVMKL